MIFEDWELLTIEKALDYTAQNVPELSFDCLKIKIERIRSESINKRYTLRTTDWLVENGKKSAITRKGRRK